MQQLAAGRWFEMDDLHFLAESPVFLANATRVKKPLSPVGEPNGMRFDPPFATKMQQVETTNCADIATWRYFAIAIACHS